MNTLRLSFFLALRYVQRVSIWQTVLVVFVMLLTFLNLVFVSGILVGLIEGSTLAYKNQYSGELILTRLPEREYIEETSTIISQTQGVPGVVGVAPRYVAGGTVESSFSRPATRRNALADSAAVQLVGIDPATERSVTGIDELMVEGEFLTPGDADSIVLGASMVERYVPGNFGLATVSGVQIGDKVRVRVNGSERDLFVKGILKSKAGVVDTRAYVLDSTLRLLTGRSDTNAGEIALRVAPGTNPERVREVLIIYGVDQFAAIQTADEAIGEFIDDIKNTFAILGNVVGGIGLVVASITIFIVIFIAAITRRKYIGILKAIGVTEFTIELSYMFLSLFYAALGIALGVVILYTVLVPYFNANPIDFPFSDGILAVTPQGVFMRILLLSIATLIAGYLPAKLIVRKNALDAILGR